MTNKFKRFALASLMIPALALPAVADQQTDNVQFIRTAAPQSFETDFTQAAEKTVNAVVCIKSFTNRSSRQSYGGYGGSDPFDMFEFFFGQPRQQQPQRRQQRPGGSDEQVQSGLGSGVILTDDGYIVTNNHVIDGATKLEVLLNDNSVYIARIVGTDEASDLALIKIDAKGLSPVTFGDSEDLKIGEWVLAVGNPFGFTSTVTAGIVSAKARSLGQASGRPIGIESFIQTDAALNPGNSGGALVNLKGELVGINSAIYSNTGSYTGFSFAIPATIVKKVMTDLRQYGTVQRAVLGCTVMDLNSELAKEKDITATKVGVYIESVEDRSTAKELGLQKGDVVVAINDKDVHNRAQLVEQLNKFRPGDQISVSYYRDNKRYTKSATLRNNQGSTGITKKNDFTSLGCAFTQPSREVMNNLGISRGVQVSGLKSGAFRDAGVKDGFIIMDINDTPVSSADDVEAVYEQAMKGSDHVLFLTGMYPTGKKVYYAVDLSDE